MLVSKENVACFIAILRNKTLKHILWFYTLAALFFKCIILIGFMLNRTHLMVAFRSALRVSFPYWPFFFSFIMLFLSFSFLFKNRWRLWYLILINFFFSVLFLIDLWYYRGFETLPSFLIFRQTANLNNMSEGILSVIHAIDAVLIADVLAIAIFALIKRNFYRALSRAKLFFASSFLISVVALAFIPSTIDIFSRSWMGTNELSYKLSPIGYQLYGIYLLWRDSKPVHLATEETNEIREWFREKIENLPDNKYKGMFKGKNLIHIDVESMESFVINQKINGQEITPNLNRLLKNSLYFSNIYEQVNQGNSSDADLLVNTSVYPLRQNSTFFAYPDTTYNSLPKLLENLGYSTLALHPDEGSFWNWMPALTSIGFQKCIGAEHWEFDETFFLGITDSSFFRQAEPHIAKLKQPFYAFMPTQSSHSPFDIPEEYRYLNLESHMAYTTLGLYFQAMHYADKCIGEMISYLERDGLLENTVIVICGDHAGITRYHPGEAEKVQPSQDWWLVTEKKIPFIIYQKYAEPEEFKVIGGQIDIMPTVAYLMGVDEKEYAYSAMGRNLLKTKKNFAVLNNGEYVGDASSEKEKQHALKGLEIADLIIKSNYFKKYYESSTND